MNFIEIEDRIVSHAAATGYFDSVNAHEPRSAPGSGITAAVWLQRLRPLTSSGLASTSGAVEFVLRIYQGFLSEPLDTIDSRIMEAVDTLLTAYSGDFELGGNVRSVDLLGAYGPGLSVQAGYLTVDRTLYRIVDITIPLIVNDLWDQSA